MPGPKTSAQRAKPSRIGKQNTGGWSDEGERAKYRSMKQARRDARGKSTVKRSHVRIAKQMATETVGQKVRRMGSR